MTIVNLFISFINKFLDFKIFNITLFQYLITFTITIFIFKLIQILGNSNSKHNKNNYEPRHEKK